MLDRTKPGAEADWRQPGAPAGSCDCPAVKPGLNRGPGAGPRAVAQLLTRLEAGCRRQGVRTRGAGPARSIPASRQDERGSGVRPGAGVGGEPEALTGRGSPQPIPGPTQPGASPSPDPALHQGEEATACRGGCMQQEETKQLSPGSASERRRAAVTSEGAGLDTARGPHRLAGRPQRSQARADARRAPAETLGPCCCPP